MLRERVKSIIAKVIFTVDTSVKFIHTLSDVNGLKCNKFAVEVSPPEYVRYFDGKKRVRLTWEEYHKN